jgi:uncharacterized protein (TIGR02217 family)
MSDLVFPVLAGAQITRTRSAVWNGVVHESTSGRTVALSAATYPRWRYRLSYEFLRSDQAHAELQQIVGLFNRCRGRADTFLFYDDDDCAVAGQGIGTGDGSSRSFQLLRTLGGFVEPVIAPKTISSVMVDGVPVGYTLLSGGKIQLAAAPVAGAVVAWTGNYYWRCRFEANNIDFERFLRDLWSAKSVDFMTVKP